MIEAAVLYACSTLLFAGAAMIGCVVGHPPPFPAAMQRKVMLFASVWALVTCLKFALDTAFGPVNVLIPITLAAFGARFLLVRFSK